jgi:hypothetical protein
MKKGILIAGLLIGFLGVAVQICGEPQEGGREIKQKVSKTAKKAASLAKVAYQGPPQFASIRGTSISYATNANQEILNIGNAYFLYFAYFKVWLVSPSAEGPWVPARLIPEEATLIVCAQLHADPFEPYQLCALPWTSYPWMLEE